MNRDIYNRVRQSIKENGLRYTAQHAIDTDDTDALIICDDLANIVRETDWLAMRAQFARNEPAALAFKLTCSPWLLRRDMGKPVIWSTTPSFVR